MVVEVFFQLNLQKINITIYTLNIKRKFLKSNLENRFYFSKYYGDNIKKLKNFISENREVGKYKNNKVLFKKEWEKVPFEILENSRYHGKFGHPQEKNTGYIIHPLFEKIKVSIYRTFTKTPRFESFNKPNIFLEPRSYLNTRNFAVTNGLDVLMKRKNYDNSSIVESVNNSLEIQDKIDLDLEEKIDIITQNNIIFNLITSEERAEVLKHISFCKHKFDEACVQCIIIENKYGIINIASEFIKMKIGL